MGGRLKELPINEKAPLQTRLFNYGNLKMTIDNVLARLEKVKQTGKESYIACCPSHNDIHPSLSLRDLPDGRILIHCFAGCDPNSILSSIDLDMNALFPNRLSGFKGVSRPFPAADVLKVVGFECLVVASSALKILGGEVFTPTDRERLVISVGRIQSAINASGVAL